ncbi:nucleotide exchange factor GrpE [Candidatus Woesearchaeota archaeon]|nr:nucleotide exchange factor GrpE [Candidatus Woesearchaeota archaeon]
MKNEHGSGKSECCSREQHEEVCNPCNSKCSGECSELKDILQRLQADFENYKKRCARESAEAMERGSMDVLAGILPVLDSFELALKSLEGQGRISDGVRMIYAQLCSALESLGLRKIEALGMKFDPNVHEALMVEDSDKGDVVLEEFQKGYVFKDAVLRHSRVKIGKNPII